MKRNNCKHEKFHPAGSFFAVAEGGDDPYAYWYCSKGHWCGDDSIPSEEMMEVIPDPFIDCSDFINEANQCVRLKDFLIMKSMRKLKNY